MLFSYHLTTWILALVFGYLQLQGMVSARATGHAYRSPNVTNFAPAQTYNPGHRGNQNFTRAVVSPNWSAPVNNQASGWATPIHNRTVLPSSNHAFYGAPPAVVPAQNYPGAVPPGGWFQTNIQGQIGTPTTGFGKSNATFNSAKSQTYNQSPQSDPGRPYSSNPFANLSV
ncbi:hypothetical protein KR009_006819 [Drosophila setifemur]|nr:hypothetical protein KR009_006819 [Drosophila setifemur]